MGREVAVERHLAHLRLGRDPVDADGPNALAVKELRGCGQDAFARRAHRCEDQLGVGLGQRLGGVVEGHHLGRDRRDVERPVGEEIEDGGSIVARVDAAR